MVEIVRYVYRLRPGATAERALLAAVALGHAYKVRGRGKTTFKARKKTLPSLEYTTRGFSIRDARLRLPGGVSVPVVWSRELPSDPSSVRVYRDSLRHWYASIGIDWGVATTATTTDPVYDLPYGGHRRRCAAELSRRAPGQARSNGYRRAKRQAAKIHKKAARQNTHSARNWARRVVDDHHTIAVEDFKPKFLAKSTMARKAADAAIGRAKRELIERGLRAGRKVVLVPSAYTTMTCSSCFAIAKQRLGLAERTFRCDQCGYTADRDRNAARTILATIDPDRAGVDDVRHCSPPSKGAGGAVRVRNPPASTVGKG